MYQREESDSVKAFYRLYAEWMDSIPDDMSRLVEFLAGATGLPRVADEYPVDDETIRSAAAAFQEAARVVYQFSLDAEDDDASQLDRLADQHLIDPALRPFFGEQAMAEPSDEESERYVEAREGLRVPNEPLLYFCMGAFWGQWQVRHRQASWALCPPLNPVQSFPDMITQGSTICSHPFSQVCKKLTDPEGDNLAYKVQVSTSQKQYLPPYPLLASLADADYAVRQLLAEPAQRALDAEEAGDDEQAWALFCEAAVEDDEHPQLLSLMIACAWRLKKAEMVDGISRRLLGLVPDHPVTCHNLAVLYSNQPDLMPKAIDLLERALASDPRYSRAHITIAYCLAETGRIDEAREHAEWVRDNDTQLKDEAEELLNELG